MSVMSIIGAVFVAGAYGAATCENTDFMPAADPCLENNASEAVCVLDPNTNDCAFTAATSATCTMATQDCAGAALADSSACDALTNCAYTAMSTEGKCDNPAAADTDPCNAGVASADACQAVDASCTFAPAVPFACNYVTDPCAAVDVEASCTGDCTWDTGAAACANGAYPTDNCVSFSDASTCNAETQCTAVEAAGASCTTPNFVEDPCLAHADKITDCEADVANSCVFTPTTGASCDAKTDTCAVDGDACAASDLTCDFTAAMDAKCMNDAFTPAEDPCIANNASEADCVKDPNTDNCKFTPDSTDPPATTDAPVADPTDAPADASSGFRAFSVAAFAAAVMAAMF